MFVKICKKFNNLMFQSIAFSVIVLAIMIFSITYISTHKKVFQYKEVAAAVKKSSTDEIVLDVKLEEGFQILSEQVTILSDQVEEGMETTLQYDSVERKYVIKIDPSQIDLYDELDQIRKSEKELRVKVPYKRVPLWNRMVEYLRLEE